VFCPPRDTFWDVLRGSARELETFAWSGWAFNGLDLYLESRPGLMYANFGDADISRQLSPTAELPYSYYISQANKPLGSSRRRTTRLPMRISWLLISCRFNQLFIEAQREDVFSTDCGAGGLKRIR
jgi:hypothetical protein